MSIIKLNDDMTNKQAEHTANQQNAHKKEYRRLKEQYNNDVSKLENEYMEKLKDREQEVERITKENSQRA